MGVDAISIRQAHRRLVAGSLLLLLLACAIIAVWGLNEEEHEFRHEAIKIAELLNERLNQNKAALEGLAAMYHAMDEVEHDQFFRYAQQMLANYRQLQAVSYHERVLADDLPSFEREHRSKGFFGFQVREKNLGSDSPWQPVNHRPVYFPAVFVYPTNVVYAELLGYDSYSDPVLKAAIDEAMRTGAVAESAPLRLQNGKLGYVLFKVLKGRDSGFRSAADKKANAKQARPVSPSHVHLVSIQVEAKEMLPSSIVPRTGTQVSVYYTGTGESIPFLTLGRREGMTFWGMNFSQDLLDKGHAFTLGISEPISLHAIRIEGMLIALAVIALLALIGFMRIRYALERSQAKQDLYRQQARSEAALHSIGDAVITTSQQGIVEHMNRMAEGLTGWRLSEARGMPLQKVFRIRDELSGGSLLSPVEKCIKEGRTVRLDEPVVLLSGGEDTSLIETGASPIRGPQGTIIGAVLVFHDISKEREMEDRILYQSNHDSLTGLLDRGEFERQLRKALAVTKDSNTQHALCYMDLDQFKLVNDTCGHEAGDELLVQLSALLLATVRDTDYLARLGGDEFGILLMDCSLEFAEGKAESLRELVKEFRFIWEGKSFEVGFGIGVVPITANSGEAIDVLRAADAACYAAKSRGRNQIFLYQSDDPELAKRRGEMRWARRIGEALQNHHFQLYYQAIESIHGEEDNTFHCELLMRTQEENGELISPEEFIPAAERYNLMTDIDRWVVNTAMPMIAQLHQQAMRQGQSILCGINLSGQSLGDEAFLSYVRNLLAAYQVPPRAVCFEITETSAIANFDVALEFMRIMGEQGCSFALDDFGTGMSSFTYLKRLPVNYLKIDGSFVRDMLENEVDHAMVESIHRIAHVMGIKTIAEFVEDAAILARLREMGVDYAQGYAIGHPAPLTEKLNT